MFVLLVSPSLASCSPSSVDVPVLASAQFSSKAQHLARAAVVATAPTRSFAGFQMTFPALYGAAFPSDSDSLLQNKLLSQLGIATLYLGSTRPFGCWRFTVAQVVDCITDISTRLLIADKRAPLLNNSGSLLDELTRNIDR